MKIKLKRKHDPHILCKECSIQDICIQRELFLKCPIDDYKQEDNTRMKAIIRKVYKKTITVQRTGVKFDKLVIEADCILENNEVRTYKSEMGIEYAKKYFKYCGLSSKDLIGKECEVTLRKRAFTTNEGAQGFVTEVKYLNMLNENGEPIIMTNEEKIGDDLGF